MTACLFYDEAAERAHNTRSTDPAVWAQVKDRAWQTGVCPCQQCLMKERGIEEYRLALAFEADRKYAEETVLPAVRAYLKRRGLLAPFEGRPHLLQLLVNPEWEA